MKYKINQIVPVVGGFVKVVYIDTLIWVTCIKNTEKEALEDKNIHRCCSPEQLANELPIAEKINEIKNIINSSSDYVKSNVLHNLSIIIDTMLQKLKEKNNE